MKWLKRLLLRLAYLFRLKKHVDPLLIAEPYDYGEGEVYQIKANSELVIKREW